MIELYDTDLGKIIVKPNARAKSVIARKKSTHILLTVPSGTSQRSMLNALESLKPKLIKIKPKPIFIFTEEARLQTFSFVTRVKRLSTLQGYEMTLRNNVLTILIPGNADICSEHVQLNIRNIIERVLRIEAKRILPQKVRFYARKFGLTFDQVKINKSRTRWGSCSQKKNINLSFYLLLLTEKQIDYVVLHELAHTEEMNHSGQFWNLLTKMLGEDAKSFSRSMNKMLPEGYTYFFT